jgi:hydroxymethylpyrimidine/phosphomethylpyrimidine kinase
MSILSGVKNADQRTPVALTIAGSDSGAGAGIQADLKTFSALGVYGCTVLTVITAQNTQGVSDVFALPADVMLKQLDAVLSDFDVAAAKTGALGNAHLIRVLAEYLRERSLGLVVDPVMISKHGYPLMDQAGIDTLKELMPRVTKLITPNLHEAAALTGLPTATDRKSMSATAEALGRAGWRACVVKGGHLAGEALDLLWDDGIEVWLPGKRVETQHLHGTGCTFSAAIVAGLVQGLELTDAVVQAKEYITGAIEHVVVYGHGVNPVNHFWRGAPL